MRLFSILTLALILFGCSHSNELKGHAFAEKSVEYKYHASVLDKGYTPPGDDLFQNVMGVTGNDVVSIKVIDKLRHFAKPELIVESISSEMSEGVSTYLKLAVDNRGASDYIFETDLQEYRIACTEEGLMIGATVHCRLVDRKTGKAVWDDKTSKEVYWVKEATVNDDGQVVAISCRELAVMSDNEIRKGLNNITEHIAASMIETMREDVLEFED